MANLKKERFLFSKDVQKVIQMRFARKSLVATTKVIKAKTMLKK